jgi:hypothetical protein
LLKISTDSTFKYDSSAKFVIQLVPRKGVTVKSVLNNCVANKTDSTKTCTTCGGLVVPTLTRIKSGPVLELTGIEANTRSVIRIDLILGCDIACDCHCGIDEVTGLWTKACKTIQYVRIDYINGATAPKSTTNTTTHKKKRSLQETQRHADDCSTIDRNIDALAMFFNDYEVNGDYFKIPLVTVDFINVCDILRCSDLSGCWDYKIPGQIEGTYKDRRCDWHLVSCDDGDPCTIDQCIPPHNPTAEQSPANCIHINSCESNEITGYCHDYLELGAWNCSQKCKSDEDCPDPSQEGTKFCLFVDEGYCKNGDGELFYCYSDVKESFDCSKSCYRSDCGDGERCLSTIQCSSKFKPHLMQQENSEMGESSKQQQQQMRGLSAVQLGGIIGGCVGFVVIGILMIVVVIMKRKFNQQKINSEIIDTLQVPLNQ